MPSTGAILPDPYYGDGEAIGPVKIWLGSVPPYYCYNNGAPGNDLSADDTWIGVSSGASAGVPTSKTTGVKFAYTKGIDLNADAPSYYNSGGVKVNWIALNEVGGPYYVPGTAEGNWGLANNYEVTTARYDMPFGPYDLSKTTDGTPYPATDGDIIVVTTGSDVIAGALGDGATPYSNLDTRAFNLIFYSTGSDYVNDLVQKIPENNSPGVNTQLTNYNQVSRNNFVINSGGLFAFVAIPDQASTSLIWWPITWDASGPSQTINIFSRNDA